MDSPGPSRDSMRWSASELDLIRQAVSNVERGASIYGEVKRLGAGPLNQSRSPEAIRTQIRNARKKHGNGAAG